MTAKPHPLPQTEGAPWPLWRLGLLLYPFVAMAVWLNLFMLGLMATWMGWPNLSPIAALFAALAVALPVDYLAALWLRRLLDRANAP
ncbi:hypothetical protein [Paracoccus xiamenensis]|uniref:hypothetical protein n=1 Tax=Paracoccus xiamenensis TaxID=2714901 RepID=UPI001407FAE5|nr:hypothetical protein [Paracoccus xiamenensis]NHF73206.1 hypothetical protein [Paracoccus xiamenensis]